MVKMKPIKPAPFKSAAIHNRMVGAAKRTVALAEKEFDKTTATWDHKPAWVKSQQGISWAYYTVDQIYNWVSLGTAGPYPIPKAGPGKLAFPSGYKAKTTPNVVHSSPGGSFGPTVFVTGQVMHPGIEARNFDTAVAKFVEPWWIKWTSDAIKVGVRESGHSIGG